MLLIREHIDLPNHLAPEGYLTYADQIVGICAPKSDLAKLERIKTWLDARSDRCAPTRCDQPRRR
jgi:hypothetical protein